MENEIFKHLRKGFLNRVRCGPTAPREDSNLDATDGVEVSVQGEHTTLELKQQSLYGVDVRFFLRQWVDRDSPDSIEYLENYFIFETCKLLYGPLIDKLRALDYEIKFNVHPSHSGRMIELVRDMTSYCRGGK